MNENATETQKPKRLKNVLLVILKLFLVFSVTISFVTGLALGVGYCLSGLIPGIELGPATIIALLAQFTVLYVALKILTHAPFMNVGHEYQDLSDEDHDEDFAAEVAEQVVDVMLARSELLPTQTTAHRKRNRQKAVR